MFYALIFNVKFELVLLVIMKNLLVGIYSCSSRSSKLNEGVVRTWSTDLVCFVRENICSEIVLFNICITRARI